MVICGRVKNDRIERAYLVTFRQRHCLLPALLSLYRRRLLLLHSQRFPRVYTPVWPRFSPAKSTQKPPKSACYLSSQENKMQSRTKTKFFFLIFFWNNGPKGKSATGCRQGFLAPFSTFSQRLEVHDGLKGRLSRFWNYSGLGERLSELDY